MILKTTALFVLTALAELVGCFLPYVWLRKGGSMWLLVPAIASLTLFVWLLTLHPAASGRVHTDFRLQPLTVDGYRPQPVANLL